MSNGEETGKNIYTEGMEGTVATKGTEGTEDAEKSTG
jgi:hypothetical protein